MNESIIVGVPLLFSSPMTLTILNTILATIFNTILMTIFMTIFMTIIMMIFMTIFLTVFMTIFMTILISDIEPKFMPITKMDTLYDYNDNYDENERLTLLLPVGSFWTPLVLSSAVPAIFVIRNI